MTSLQKIKLGLGILTLALATGCSSGGGDSSPSKKPTPTPQPDPKPQTLSWGQLDCQKDQSCDNFILNITFDQWNKILTETQSLWSQKFQGRTPTPEEASLHCGALAYKSFTQTVATHQEMNDTERTGLINFMSRTLNSETCSIKSDLLNKMNSYLKESL